MAGESKLPDNQATDNRLSKGGAKDKASLYTWRGRLVRLLTVLLGVLIALISSYRKLPNEKKLLIVLSVADYLNSFDDHTLYNQNENPYLQGNFAPTKDENVDLLLPEIVSGKVPKDLSGLFLRIGPNQIPGHYSRRYHLFDGNGMIHAIRVLPNGQLRYTNQYVLTPRYQKERALDRSIFLLVGELKGILGLLKVMFLYPLIEYYSGYSTIKLGQANTAIVQYNNRLFATHEGSLPFEFNWNDTTHQIESVGYETLNDQLNFPVTAHCKVDPEDGGMYFNGYNPSDKNISVKYGHVDRQTNLKNYFEISTSAESFAHDLAITENYVLNIESSIHFTPEGIMEGVFFNFVPSHKLRVGVVHKRDTQGDHDVIWFTADRAYSLVHVVNAWEELNADKQLEIVLVAPLGDSFDGTLKITTKFTMHELRMNMQTKKLTVTPIDTTHAVEFPRSNPLLVGRPTRYGYASKLRPGHNGLNFHGVVKYDLEKKQVAGVILLPEESMVSGEFVPIPKQRTIGVPVSKVKSDAVYLASFVFNEATNSSEWLVYDGESMKATPVLRVKIPVRVPYGFHGEWIAEEVLKQHLHNVQQSKAVSKMI